jgi:hypothetical protein
LDNSDPNFTAYALIHSGRRVVGYEVLKTFCRLIHVATETSQDCFGLANAEPEVCIFQAPSSQFCLANCEILPCHVWKPESFNEREHEVGSGGCRQLIETVVERLSNMM